MEEREKEPRCFVVAFRERREIEEVYSLASDKVAPGGCATLLSCSCCCCCWRTAATHEEGSQPFQVASDSTVDDRDAHMAPSAPVTLAPPTASLPSAATAAAAEPPFVINGHSEVPTVKLPGKSNLKHSSTSSSSASYATNGGCISRAEADLLSNSEAGADYPGDVVVAEPEKRDCKVQWIDNFGQDLIQVHEFEPR